MTMVPFVAPGTTTPLEPHGDTLVGPDGERVPIVRGIPRFVPSELNTLVFGLQWNGHPETQLDSRTGADLSEARLEWYLGMPLAALLGKTVLEPGAAPAASRSCW